MKTLLILLIFICPKLFAPPMKVQPEVYPIDFICDYNRQYEINQLWIAVCQVESGRDPLKINPDEMAFGIAQVRQIRLDDYFERTGIRFELVDMFDTIKAKRVFLYYAKGEIELIAKRWNGSGPMTEEYWNKVRVLL